MADDPVRHESERLVAAALAAASLAARGLSAARGRAAGYATGSPECCVCPVCRVIAAMRDPDPELAHRLAVGAGDLAAGLAGILRALSSRGESGADGAAGAGDEFWESLGERARATAAQSGSGIGERPARPSSDDPWRAATSAPSDSGPARPAPGPAVAKKAMAKKAVAKKAVANKAAANKAAANKAAANKAAAKRAGTKRAAGGA